MTEAWAKGAQGWRPNTDPLRHPRNDRRTHCEACPGAQVFGGHQQGIEGGSSAAHARLGVLHGQQQRPGRDLLPLLPHFQLCGQNAAGAWPPAPDLSLPALVPSTYSKSTDNQYFIVFDSGVFHVV